MNCEELALLESQLSLTLPEEYKATVTPHPFPETGSYDYELCGDYEALLQGNLEVRREGFFGEPWNPTWFVIGLHGCGNDYFITTDPFDGNIYFADYEEKFYRSILSANPHHKSMDEFLDFLEEAEKEIREEELVFVNRIKSRSWRQFWMHQTRK